MQNGVLRFSRSFRLGENHLSEQRTQFIGELQRSIAAAKTYHDTDTLDTTENAGDLTPSETETELWLCGSGARIRELTTAC